MNIGVILKDLGPSQLAYEAISSANREIESGSPHSFTIFYENLAYPCIKPLCSLMNISYAWGMTGLLITTSLDNTSLIMNSAIEAKKVFHVYDLEFMHGKTNFLENLNIYRNLQISLTTRSVDYAKAINNYANRSVHAVIETLDVGMIASLFADKVPTMDSRALRFGMEWANGIKRK